MNGCELDTRVMDEMFSICIGGKVVTLTVVNEPEFGGSNYNCCILGKAV